MSTLDNSIKAQVNENLLKLEKHFKGDVVFFYGAIHPYILRPFRDFIENLQTDKKSTERLVFFLNTPGGSAEVVEKIVEIIRFHYKDVIFVVPDMAFSAGTILCMSGDQIFMDYSSALGPIDPQVFNGREWVPALGYLDKVSELLDKARQKILTDAEFLILQALDLALLKRYEQARDLTVTLLKKWLVEYKFKDWKTHQTTPKLIGKLVKHKEKEVRAEEIARLLGDNNLWHSHGRMIGVSTLKRVLKLKIDDYSDNKELRELIRGYNDLLTDYIAKNQFRFFLHNRNHF
jgi:hypothetical protein